jgi:hypothetical protein
MERVGMRRAFCDPEEKSEKIIIGERSFVKDDEDTRKPEVRPGLEARRLELSGFIIFQKASHILRSPLFPGPL